MSLNLRELWEYRDLLMIFVWRDLKVRYKQTLLGMSWTIINPVVNTLIFALLFGVVAETPKDGIPTLLFFMSGLAVWRYFSNTLTAISASLVGGAGLYTKIYFPKLIIPINLCVAGLVDLVISLIILVPLLFYYHVPLSLSVLGFPVLVLMSMLAALGPGLFLGALNVRYRDVGSLVPFIVQIWMYASLVVPSSKVQSLCLNHVGPVLQPFFAKHFGMTLTDHFLTQTSVVLYGLNPMAGVVEGIRWSLFRSMPGTQMDAPWLLMASGLPFICIALLVGFYYFKRVENQFADIV